MSKPQKLNWEEVLDTPTNTNAIEVDSIVNQAYIDNLPNVRKRIEEINRNNAEAYNQVKDWLIK